MDARAKAIIAHITPVGWIISFILNLDNKDEFASFYLRQTLGIWIAGVVLSWVPVINIFVGIVVFAFWLLSLIYAIQGDRKEVPFGNYFQEWFNGL